ncbi:major capsid protein [Paraburkholderia sp.]|uniref:major capsid protein n=1 Tax=Paraburkholderia sp. TaxID=1926495 RepID=UPI003D6DF540
MFMQLKQVVAAVKGVAKQAAVGVVAAGASVAAFAQTTAATPAFNDGAIMTSINGVAPIIIDVGGAVLAIVTVAWGFKTVKGFLGGR